MKYFAIFLKISVVALAVGGVFSCTKDPNGFDNKVGVRFSISAAGETIVNTRSSESAVTDVYILVLDGNDDNANVIDWAEASSMGEHTYYASLKKTTTKGYICVLANVARTISGGGTSWTTLGEIKNNLKIQLRKSGSYIVEDPIFTPMVSDILDYSAENAILDADVIAATLKRNTAAVTVVNKTANPKFSLMGTNLGNAPDYGYVFERTGSVLLSTIGNYAGLVSGTNYSPEVMMRGVSADPLVTMPLYLFESSAKNETFVVVKCRYNGVTGYHRINIWDPRTSAFHEILRNYRYVVNITRISSAGYATAQEAINNPASNRDISVDIEVQDPISRDIVSNGEYYLGVSNSEFIFYTSEALNDYVVASVAHNASAGLTFQLSDETVEGTGRITYTNPFNKGTGAVQTGDLKVSIPPTVIKSDLILRIGNLSQRIRIERRENLLSFGGAIPLNQKYIYGKVEDGTDHWCRIAAHGGANFENAVAEYVSPEDQDSDLYMVLTDNIYMNEGTPRPTRSADLVFYKANEEGHTRILIQQPSFNIFGDPEVSTGKIINPYVGAFWRNDQTGERVIKMLIQGSPSQLSWDAQVAVGHDWIRLQTGGSTDPSIYTATPMLGTDPAFETTRQLTDMTRTLIRGEKENVMFRIGLVGTIGKTDHRYGVVIVNTYVDKVHQNTYRIFVRQGDAADYLYRKTDNGYNGWGLEISIPRPKSKKITPYNLTDPLLGTGSRTSNTNWTNYLTHNKMPLDYDPRTLNTTFNRAKFTQFPSQAGYMFVWNINTDEPVPGQDNREYMRAYHPKNNASLAVPLALMGENFSGISGIRYGEIPILYDKKADPCPYGYRYPSQGKIVMGDYTITTPEESEMIQSMLFDPDAPTRDPASALEAMAKYTLWGYYADGFFDRLPITDLPAFPASKAMYGTDVSNATGNDYGYIGQVIFNPYNYASIFFPATGRHLPSGNPGADVQEGGGYYLWVSERDNTNSNRADIYPMDMRGTQTSFGILKSQGSGSQIRTVRCVRDDTTWPNNGE